MTGQTDDNGEMNNVEIMILTWSTDCVIIYTYVANQVPTFPITEANLYVPVVTLSTEGNGKLLPQLNSYQNQKYQDKIQT